MAEGMNLVLTCLPLAHAGRQSEICEHKGDGHPDSLCDGVAEAVSQALCRAYLQAYGEIRHHNVDKALLIGGQSAPRFGGGSMTARMRLIIAGRAEDLPGDPGVAELATQAARRYLITTVGAAADWFDIESVIRTSSPNLRRVMPVGQAVPLANDTSFGVGFAPFSPLEQAVLALAKYLRSSAFKMAYPMAGFDFKIMGSRASDRMAFTVALAFIDREVKDAAHYFQCKQAIAQACRAMLPLGAQVHLNTLDDVHAQEESGIYLTVTGLSAEHGDDGQVGRGNRVNGLITPFRPMSLEAAAGKNPISHVGKIYNVLAGVIANDLVSQVNDIEEATVHLLSSIGRPISQPQLVAVQAAAAGKQLSGRAAKQVREIVRARLEALHDFSQQLSQGQWRVF